LTYETAELGAEGPKICRRAGLGGLLGVERFAWLPYGCLALVVVVASWLPVIRGPMWETRLVPHSQRQGCTRVNDFIAKASKDEIYKA
jgi:hypothetical protein